MIITRVLESEISEAQPSEYYLEKSIPDWNIDSAAKDHEKIDENPAKNNTISGHVSENFISDVEQVRDWKSFSKATKDRGQRYKMHRPALLPIWRDRSLENNVLKENVGNYIVIQAHPGWGKTSNLGEALFPEDKEKTKFLIDYTILGRNFGGS